MIVGKAYPISDTTWTNERATAKLRWACHPNTTTVPPRLQQLWEVESPSSVKYEWRDVPLAIVDPEPKKD